MPAVWGNTGDLEYGMGAIFSARRRPGPDFRCGRRWRPSGMNAYPDCSDDHAHVNCGLIEGFFAIISLTLLLALLPGVRMVALSRPYQSRRRAKVGGNRTHTAREPTAFIACFQPERALRRSSPRHNGPTGRI